jgi:ribokinase
MIRLSFDVITIGNIVSDFVAAPVKRMPCWGELYSIEKPINMNIGGNAAIFSVCASQLGLHTGLIGKIGDDEIGKMLLTKLSASSVDVSGVKISTQKPTSVTLAIANEQGDRSFFHHFGANSDLSIKDINIQYFNDTKALLLCSYFIMPGLDGKPAKKILQTAKDNNLITFFDVAWDPSGRWKVKDILDNVDVFIPNEDEITSITHKSSISDAVKDILASGVDTVVVKLGSKGCYIKNKKGKKVRLDAYKVNAIDATGAGDSFNAGFVYGILNGWDLEKTGRFANAAGALSVTKLGGATAAPKIEEVEEFMKNS